MALDYLYNLLYYRVFGPPSKAYASYREFFPLTQVCRKNAKTGGLSRAAATLLVEKLHINEGISTQDREKLISEYMTPKDPSPDLKQKAQEMLDAMLGRN